jgi:UDP-N-acetylglucosamine 2-epimerase (non-hydrolysing)
MLIHLVCAARPNFMKVAPLYHALKKEEWARPVIVHAGQHYDTNMSDAFFEDLGLPKPDIQLGIGSGSHAEQTGKVMMSYEKVLTDQKPDLVVVVGDVNSTMAATIAACKITYPTNNSINSGNKRPLIAHLEAGLRSFDRTMPEEINRLVTDALADMLWVPSADAVNNLISEGVASDKIQLVGNIMIDSLETMRQRIEEQTTYREFGLTPGNYGVVTFHRPANVDAPATLKLLCNVLREISERIPLVFPIHPRTRKNMEEHQLFSTLQKCKDVFLPEPLSYVRFMNLVLNSLFAITDSGGIQEETTYLGIPCLTVRENTERPVTITHGTNRLCALEQLNEKVSEIVRGGYRQPPKIQYWDGKTAGRIVEVLRELEFGNGSH